MSISQRIFEATAGVRDRAAAYAQEAAIAARQAAERAAARAEAAEGRVAVLVAAGRQLNTLAYDSAGRMLDQGAQTLNGFIGDGATRLRLAAGAVDVGNLYRAQLEHLPVSRRRIVKDARATWSIVADAGRELQSLAVTTYARLVRNDEPRAAGRKAGSRKSPGRKTARRARRAA
jgi:hypothetical protein